MVVSQDYKSRWTQNLLPFHARCDCGKELIADYHLDPGRFLHLSAWCDGCERFALEDVVSDKMIPFEDTRYDYTIRKSAARPALIAKPGVCCEKCQSGAMGTFNIIREVETAPKEHERTGRIYKERIFELVSGPHHRCERHLMSIDENVIPFRGWACE